jgi:hypothetical protein
MLSTESEPLCHWISKKIRPENLVFDVEKVGNYRTLHISLEKPWFAVGFLKIFHKIPWLKKTFRRRTSIDSGEGRSLMCPERSGGLWKVEKLLIIH